MAIAEELCALRRAQLKGTLKDHWNVRVSGNWRISFRLENGNAYVVDYLAHHWASTSKQWDMVRPPATGQNHLREPRNCRFDLFMFRIESKPGISLITCS